MSPPRLLYGSNPGLREVDRTSLDDKQYSWRCLEQTTLPLRGPSSDFIVLKTKFVCPNTVRLETRKPLGGVQQLNCAALSPFHSNLHAPEHLELCIPGQSLSVCNLLGN